METANGSIAGTNAVLQYVASLGGQLNGSSAVEAAQVSQWLNWSVTEVDLPGAAWLYPIKGIIENNAAVTAKAKADVRKALGVVNDVLAQRTFLVGERLSLADIAVALSLLELYTEVLDAGFRKQFVNTNRWFNTVVNQPQVRSVVGEVVFAQKMKVAPEAKPKEAAPAPAKAEAKPKEVKPKEEKPKAAAGGDDMADWEKEIAEEGKKKGPNPLDLLPPSPLVLDELKRQYSNTDTRSEFVPWFWKNLDREGYSVWLCEYLFPEDNDKVFKVANLVAGWLQRADPLRKYGFGSVVISGDEPRLEINGVWVFRGQEVPFEMRDTPDFESYKFEKANLEDAETRSFIEDLLAWDGNLRGKKFSQGKAYK